jgi:outer membrane protein
MRIKYLLSFSLAALISGITAAEETSAKDSTPLTIERVAELARQVAPEIAAARLGQSITELEIRGSYAFVYPHLSASASYTRSSLDYNEIPIFGNVAFNREDEYRAGVTWSQFLYTYDRLGAAQDADRFLTQLAKQQVALTQRDMSYAARIAFEQVRLTRAALLIAQLRVTQRQGEYDDAKALADIGRATLTDANLAQISFAHAQSELVAAQSDHETARVKLSALIGYELAKMPAVQDEPLPRPDLAQLIAHADKQLTTTGEPVRLQLQENYEQAVSRLERSQARPSLNARATYGGDGAQYDNLDAAWSVSVALNWDLYDGGLTLAHSERSAQRSQQIRLERAAIQRDRRIKLDQARSQSRSILEQITLAEQVVTLAKQNYDDARAQYRAGRLTQTQVGDSSIRLADAYYRLLSVRYQEAVIAHELERLAE